MEIKNFSAEDLKNPSVLIEAMNGIFKEYRDAIALRTTKEETEKLQAQLIVKTTDLQSKITEFGAFWDERKKELDELKETINIQGGTITKMKDAWNTTDQKKSFASQIIEGAQTKEFKDFVSGKASKASFQIDTKDVAFTGTYGSGAVGQAYMPYQVPQMPDLENFDVRLILPTGTINSSSLQYPTERAASLTDATAHKGENTAAAESTMGFEMGTAYATRITAFIEVSRSALQNTTWLNGYIANRLLAMFVKNLNTQSIAGAGSGAGMVGDNALKGLLAFANSFAGTNFASKIANANYFDVLNCAKGEMNGLYHQLANTYLLNPYTGTILTSSKNTISDFVSPATFLQPNNMGYMGAFGMKQVETADVTIGEYLVANISPSNMQLLFNGPIEILATDSHASQFISDIVAIKIEGRVLLPVYNSNSLMKGVFDTNLNTINIS